MRASTSRGVSGKGTKLSPSASVTPRFCPPAERSNLSRGQVHCGPCRAASASPNPTRAEIAAALAELRESLEVSLDFPAEVLADAKQSVREPRLPDADETAIPFVTIDPPESQDLDQALQLERAGKGYRVRYAIADVAAFVTPGGADGRRGARARADALRAGRERPPVPADACPRAPASLLPDEIRPAIVWTMELDATGEGSRSTFGERSCAAARSSTTRVSSARSTTAPRASRCSCCVRSACCGSSASDGAERSTCRFRSRWSSKGAGRLRLAFRAPLPVERWNAQISLLTGQAARS